MLPVSNIVDFTINLSPLAAAARSFGVLMIAGDSDVISGLERFRTYTDIDGVVADFGTSGPEYNAAVLYFGQTPKPPTLMIGRWLRTATSGFNLGGILSSTEQALSNWTGITDGAFKITVDGSQKSLTSLNFSGQTSLNGVATVITTALSGSATCTWTGSSFKVTSATTGTSSLVTAAISPASGTDISAQLKLTAGTLLVLTPGYAPETALACATALASASIAWYGLMFQASTQPVTSQFQAISAFIEAQTVTRIFGITTTDTATLSSASTTDLAYLLAQTAPRQTFIQYSQNAYAVASFFGRAFSVNFNQSATAITLMFKQEPGVASEDLTSAQAAVLAAKRCNVFAGYVNATNIIQYGVMCGPSFFDEIHGLDWFQNTIQTACYNVLYTSTTKIPQTDGGVNQLVNAISGVCDQAVANGLVAPGTWTAGGFGTLQTGQFLKTGYYIFAQPVALQSQADREARLCPPIQIALKLAGAIQNVTGTINVNR